MKQNKLIIHPSTSLLFLLFYSPKPRTQVRISIYRKWSIQLIHAHSKLVYNIAHVLVLSNHTQKS